jgi:7,8-dihydropterin-6-yl-methyl-4-(beta-D-ribofuranosyl)aminobenzene 5'-phosphate synthase
MRFVTLFDNYMYKEGFKTLWGFSCYIETNNYNILVDTGSNGRILLQNAKKLNIDFKNIDILFITHPHWDHIGGLDTVIEENPDITIIAPNSLSKHLIEDLKTLVKDVIVINKFSEIFPDIYTTGVLKPVGEQALCIEKDNRLYIITGCGHPGIENITKIFTNKLNKPIEYIIGGFHLLRSNPTQIKKVINNIHTKYITATHCTGDVAIGMFKILYKNRFLPNGVGMEVKF